MIGLAEHTATLRTQAASTVRALTTTADLLDRFLNGPGCEPAEIDALRSQARAAMRALRTTNQLLAQAAQLHTDKATQPQEAKSHEHQHRTARLG